MPSRKHTLVLTPKLWGFLVVNMVMTSLFGSQFLCTENKSVSWYPCGFKMSGFTVTTTYVFSVEALNKVSF